MINVMLQGRLGNILFQYAVGRHLALKNNTGLTLNFEYYIMRSDYFGNRIRNSLSHINIEPHLYNKIGAKYLMRIVGIKWPFPRYTVYNEKSAEFCPDVLELGRGTTINGFFQSEKYFKDIDYVIREDFKIDSTGFGKESEYFEDSILSKESVSIHVRRGDYINSSLRSICDMKYFLNSVDYIRSKIKSPHFFVFSDDIEWCTENINIPECSFVKIKRSVRNPVIDLYLMSLCKHNIISNSSFSWWGAWLNQNKEKIVIAPEKWRIDYNPGTIVMKDKLPEEWVKMPL